MSDRSQMAMTDTEVASFLDQGRRAYVATNGEDGWPHVVPMSYVVMDGEVTFWTDPASRKVRHLRNDPRITCLVEDGASVDEFRAVQLRGTALISDDPDESARTGEALFARHAPDGRLSDEARAYAAGLAPVRVAVRLRPERVVSWDHRKVAVNLQDIGS